MASIKWIFVVVTLLHVPINMFATRDQFYTFFRVKRTKRNHVILSVLITYAAFLIPVIYPNVIGVLGLFGGIFATSVCLFYPFLIAYRMREKEGKSSKYFYAVLVVFVTFIIIATAVITIMQSFGY